LPPLYGPAAGARHDRPADAGSGKLLEDLEKSKAFFLA